MCVVRFVEGFLGGVWIDGWGTTETGAHALLHFHAHAVSHATKPTPHASPYLPIQLPQQIEGRVRGEHARELEIEDNADTKRQESRRANGFERGRGAPPPVGGGLSPLSGLDHEDDAEREGDGEEGVAHEVLAVMVFGGGGMSDWVWLSFFSLVAVGKHAYDSRESKVTGEGKGNGKCART